jgi:hypothetical protein
MPEDAIGPAIPSLRRMGRAVAKGAREKIRSSISLALIASGRGPSKSARSKPSFIVKAQSIIAFIGSVSQCCKMADG